MKLQTCTEPWYEEQEDGKGIRQNGGLDKMAFFALKFTQL